MHYRSGWDWELGEKSIADISQWKDKFNWVEEPYVSPGRRKNSSHRQPG